MHVYIYRHWWNIVLFFLGGEHTSKGHHLAEPGQAALPARPSPCARQALHPSPNAVFSSRSKYPCSSMLKHSFSQGTPWCEHQAHISLTNDVSPLILNDMAWSFLLPVWTILTPKVKSRLPMTGRSSMNPYRYRSLEVALEPKWLRDIYRYIHTHMYIYIHVWCTLINYSIIYSISN